MDVLVPILIAIVALAIVFGAIFTFFHFSARASRGGVRPQDPSAPATRRSKAFTAGADRLIACAPSC